MERWGHWDALGLLQQIGAVPAPASGNPDPLAVARAYDAAWNAGDEARVMDAFADDVEIRLSPPPPPPLREVSTGEQEARDFVRALLPGFHVDSHAHRVSGNRVTWQFAASSDNLRRLGADLATGTCQATIQDGKLKTFSVAFDEATVGKLQRGQAAAAGQPH